MELVSTPQAKQITEASFMEQRHILDALLDNSITGIIVVDQNCHIVLLNDLAKQLTGLQVAHHCLKKWIKENAFFWSSSHESIPLENHPIIQGFNGQYSNGIEFYQTNRATGEKTYFYARTQAYRNDQGNVAGMVISLIDISTHKNMSNGLETSQRTEKALIQAIPDLMIRMNSSGICTDYIPPKNMDMVIPPAMFIDNHICDTLPPRVAEPMLAHAKTALTNNSLQHFEFELTQAGKRTFFEGRISPINEQEVLCIFRDVTATLAAQEALQKSADYYKMLIEKSPSPMVVYRRNGEILYINSAGLKVMGVPDLEAMKGKSAFTFLTSNQKTKAKNIVKRGFQDYFPTEPATYTALKPDGQTVDLECVGSIINYRGEMVIQVVAKDVTEQRRLEANAMQKEIQYKTLFEASTEGIAIIDFQQKSVIDCNQCLVKRLGCTSKQNILRGDLPAFSAKQQPSHGNFEEAYQIVTQKITERTTFDIQWRFKRMDNSLVDTTVTLTPLYAENREMWMAILRTAENVKTA